MKLLVIDWDFFFPEGYLLKDNKLEKAWEFFDWGHSEANPFFYSLIWPIRASSFLQKDYTLPALTGEEKTFWNRIKVSPKARLYLSDSNSQAIHPKVSAGIDELYLFDAHHDSGYQGKATLEHIRSARAYDCENWMMGYHSRGCLLHMRYPSWRGDAFEAEPAPAIPLERVFDDGSPLPLTFDRIFICRSSCWVPSWLDDQFQAFVDNAPVRKAITLGDTLNPRVFDLKTAKSLANQFKLLTDSQKTL